MTAWLPPLPYPREGGWGARAGFREVSSSVYRLAYIAYYVKLKNTIASYELGSLSFCVA